MVWVNSNRQLEHTHTHTLTHTILTLISTFLALLILMLITTAHLDITLFGKIREAIVHHIVVTRHTHTITSIIHEIVMWTDLLESL